MEASLYLIVAGIFRIIAGALTGDYEYIGLLPLAILIDFMYTYVYILIFILSISIFK